MKMDMIKGCEQFSTILSSLLKKAQICDMAMLSKLYHFYGMNIYLYIYNLLHGG